MATQKVRRSGLTMPVVTRRFVDHAWRRGCDFINLDLRIGAPHPRPMPGASPRRHCRTRLKGGAEAFTRINHTTTSTPT
jgi:hypothetical protein